MKHLQKKLIKLQEEQEELEKILERFDSELKKSQRLWQRTNMNLRYLDKMLLKMLKKI